MYWIVKAVPNTVAIKSYVLTHSKGLQPSTTVTVEIEGELLEENASGDGQYDAFLNAIRKMYKKKKRLLPQLVDYAVHIPPGSHSDALCETKDYLAFRRKGIYYPRFRFRSNRFSH